jgi:hypothetical protein
LELAFVKKLEVLLPKAAQRAPCAIPDHNWYRHQIHPAAESERRFVRAHLRGAGRSRTRRGRLAAGLGAKERPKEDGREGSSTKTHTNCYISVPSPSSERVGCFVETTGDIHPAGDSTLVAHVLNVPCSPL